MDVDVDVGAEPDQADQADQVAVDPHVAATFLDPVERTLELLRSRGGRVTTCRRLLVRCLFEGSRHRTAEELAREVHEMAPDIHLSTIYRNLDEFERLGVVVHAHLGHGPATYHLASDDHGHLVCDRCGQVAEAPGHLFRELSEAAQAAYGFKIDPRHFAVLGRCQDCDAD